MVLTVAQLIEKLSRFPPDHKVVVYSGDDEGADWAHDVISGTGERPYVKCDWPDCDFDDDSDAEYRMDTVIIT